MSLSTKNTCSFQSFTALGNHLVFLQVVNYLFSELQTLREYLLVVPEKSSLFG